MKLKADAKTFYYPDIFVAFDEQPESESYREEPVLIIEVLSPTTERIDRTEKLTVYKNIPTVREYLIVSQEKILVEVHRKLEDETWQTEIYDEPGFEIQLDSIDLALRMDEIYRRVRLENV